jgi:tyrosyl-tRNA synthetase
VYEFYQFWINTSDDDAINRLKQFTFLSKAEIEAIETEFVRAPHLRVAQKRLAEELTTLVHGKNALEEAIKITNALFSGDIIGLTLEEIEIAFKEFDSFPVDENLLLLDILVLSNLAQSKRQAREFIQNGAIQVNGEKITDTEFVVEKAKAFGQTYSIIRKGKKSYILLKH